MVDTAVDSLKDFDPSYIFSGPPVFVRKQVSYTGHATTTYSVEQAITIIDYIGQKYKSDFCLPFAVRLIEGGEMISVAEDNGEFACGELLTNCLKKMEGFNILVCVSRHVDNCYVTDMIQGQKHRAVRDAATKALDLLYASLTAKNNHNPVSPEDSLQFDINQLDINIPNLVPSRVLQPKSRERNTKSTTNSNRK